MSEVWKSYISSSQMRLLGVTPHMHYPIIFIYYLNYNNHHFIYQNLDLVGYKLFLAIQYSKKF